MRRDITIESETTAHGTNLWTNQSKVKIDIMQENINYRLYREII